MSEAGASLFEELMRFRPDGLTANGWAVKAGVSRTIWADLRRHGNPSRRTMEKLLQAVGSSLAEFEALRVGQQAALFSAGRGLADPGSGWRSASPVSIPLLAIRLAGEWEGAAGGVAAHSIDRSNAIDMVDRPAALAADRGAYAVTMAGKSMWPRFREGRRLLVSPATAVTIGDDVLIELGGGRVLIGELINRSGKFAQLRQFNPDLSFEVDAKQIASVHKVVGEAI